MSCPKCFSGGIHDHAEPKGKMETMYGFSCYVASPPAESTKKSTIFFITDAFGLRLINNKLLADRYAADTGCKVIMPDIIPGGGASPDVMTSMDTLTAPVAWTDVWGQLGRIWAVFNTVATMVPFFWRATPYHVYPRILKFARDMKNDLPAGGKLGVAGFCWGGYQSTWLCKEPVVEGGSEPLIDAQFCAHPSAVSADTIFDCYKEYKVPYSMAIGDEDIAMAIKDVLKLEATLAEKVGPPEANNYEVATFKGVKHGFACRAQKDNKAEIDASEVAAKQAAAWYNKYLN